MGDKPVEAIKAIVQSIAADKAVPGMLQRISAKNIGSSLAGKAGFKHSADGSSVYLTIPGETTSRVATHSATATLFIQDGTDNNLSIAIRRPGQFKPFKSDSSANVVEAVFPKNVLDAHPEMLPHILRDIAEFVATGEYHDTAGAMAYNYSGSDAFKAQARDRIHEDAIARGDWRTAQKMVDEQAEANGYYGPVWHGENGDLNRKDYSKLDTNGNYGAGVYVATRNRGRAEAFGDNVSELAMSVENPLPGYDARLESEEVESLRDAIRDADENALSVLDELFEGENWGDANDALSIFSAMVDEMGFVKARDIFQSVTGYDGVSTREGEAVAWNPNQLKLRNLATFDDSGELIPLSKRFDRTNSDVRYSGTRSAGAIFGGTVRVRPDGTVDYSMVKDALLARTRILQGRPEFQFGSERRSLRRTAEIAASMIERDPEGAQALIDRALDAFESGREWVPSDTELAVLFMEEVLREQRVRDAENAVRACEEGRGDRSLVDAQAALAQARADQLDFAQALAMTGKTTARALSARRIMISDDNSFGGVVDEVVRRLRSNRRLRGADGRTAPLTTEEAAKIEELVKRIQDLSDAKEKAERELKHANARIRGFEAAARQRRVAEGKVKRGERPATVEEAVRAIREKLADSELEMLAPVDLTVWPELWARMNRNVKILADAVLGEMSGRGGDLTEEQYDAFLRRLHGAVTEAYADVRFVSSDPAHGERAVPTWRRRGRRPHFQVPRAGCPRSQEGPRGARAVPMRRRGESDGQKRPTEPPRRQPRQESARWRTPRRHH